MCVCVCVRQRKQIYVCMYAGMCEGEIEIYICKVYMYDHRVHRPEKTSLIVHAFIHHFRTENSGGIIIIVVELHVAYGIDECINPFKEKSQIMKSRRRRKWKN